MRGGRVVAVDTTDGPARRRPGGRRLRPTPAADARPAGAATMPALPPVVCHLGLDGEPPGPLPRDRAARSTPLLVLRTGGRAPDGRSAWTVHGRGRVDEDVLLALARRGVDVCVRRWSRGSTAPPATWSSSGAGRRWACAGRAGARRSAAWARRRRSRACTPPARTRHPGPACPTSGCRPRWWPSWSARPELRPAEGDRQRRRERGLARLDRHRLGICACPPPGRRTAPACRCPRPSPGPRPAGRRPARRDDCALATASA